MVFSPRRSRLKSRFQPLLAQFGPIGALLREANVRQVRDPETELGEVHIEDIELGPKSSDDIPALLLGGCTTEL